MDSYVSAILDSFLLAMPIPQALHRGGGEPQSGGLMVHVN